jgi:hypothetical protein
VVQFAASHLIIILILILILIVLFILFLIVILLIIMLFFWARVSSVGRGSPDPTRGPTEGLRRVPHVV